jgi:hypothetical protein
MPGRSDLLLVRVLCDADEALVADNDGVEELDVEDATSLHQLQSGLYILR